VKAILVDIGKCTGCESCIAACAFSHTKAYNLDSSRIKVEKDKEAGIFAPVMCRQCSEAPCIESCPMGALVKDSKTGETKLLSDKCIGCRVCIEVCPFGAISFNNKTNKIEKCDLCGGDPMCVKVCNPGAVRFGDVNEASKAKRGEIIEKHKISRQLAEGV
jgi:carbon-monoxide dehydrogenase iron sulfur subunit